MSETELLARRPELKRQDAILPLDNFSADSQNLDNSNLLEELLAAAEQQASPVIDLTQEDNDQLAVVADPDIHLPLPTAVRDRFRLQAKFFFLTWPQCDTPKELVLARIKQLSQYDYAVVCRENHHDDTGVHLHAFIAFKRQMNKTGCAWLDDLADKHGNYQAARNNLKVVNYVIADGDYCADGFDPIQFVTAALSKKSTVHSTTNGKSKAFLIAEMVKEGKSVDDLDDFDPGYMLMNKRKIEDYVAWQKVKKARLEKSAWPGITEMQNMDPETATYKIALWLTENIKQPREFKQKQLFIWSKEPNVGKTHLVRELEKYLVTYHVPKINFTCGYESNRYDLLVIDEFDASFTITFLNEFVQGSTMHLNQKGGGHIKTDNPPMIILSNRSPELIYHKKCNTHPFYALLERFVFVEVTGGETIDVFHTL